MPDIKITDAPDRDAPALAKPATAAGRKLVQTYEIDGTVYGAQTIDRMATIPEMQRILTLKKTDLTRRSAPKEEVDKIDTLLLSCQDALDGKSHIPATIQAQIDALDRAIENFRAMPPVMQGNGAFQRGIQTNEEAKRHYREQCSFDWIGSNYVRDCFAQATGVGDPCLSAAVAAYQEACRHVIPAAVNLRRHEIEAGAEKITLVRAGIISDMRDGYHSLDQLVAMQEGTSSREDHYRALSDQLASLQSKNKKSTPEQAVLFCAAEKVKSDAALRKAIGERRSCMQDQMLMLVMEHLKTAQQQGDFDVLAKLPVMHLSLLNRKTDVVDATGWKKNEAVFMADMAQIFKEFDGKLLIFDGSGPLVDQDGHIHLPAEFGATGRTLPLDTYFVNVSVQGHKENDGKQAEINRLFFRKLENSNFELSSELKAIKKMLKKSSDFNVAEEFAFYALTHGMCLSIGCLSAKDRTGWLCGRLGARFVLEGAFGKEKSAAKKQAARLWSKQIFTGPAYGVCIDCNLRALEPLNVEALKLTEPTLADVGKVDRAEQMAKLVSMTANPKYNNAHGPKVATPSRRRRGWSMGSAPLSVADPAGSTPMVHPPVAVYSAPAAPAATPAIQPSLVAAAVAVAPQQSPAAGQPQATVTFPSAPLAVGRAKRLSLGKRVANAVRRAFSFFSLRRLVFKIRQRLGKKKQMHIKAAA